MKIIHQEYSFPSATGVCQIYAQSWAPEEGVKAIVQIHHGMAEHSDRYIDFARYLCSRGYGVYIHDMANHGKSNQDLEQTGFFGEKDGWKNLVEDMKTVMELARQAYPGLPYFVFGHSMGSFVTRCFIAKYGQNLDGAVICGTSGRNPLAGVSITLSSLIGKLKGKLHKSNLLEHAGFGAYNKGLPGRTDKDWLTRDDAVVDRYIADPMCGFVFSVQGFNDLGNLLVSANADAWYAAVARDLPLCLISGTKDPVGNYGKGIEEVYQKLKHTGHNVSMKLYAEARHEILNETNKDAVYDDVANFFDNVLEGNLTEQ